MLHIKNKICYQALPVCKKIRDTDSRHEVKDMFIDVI